MFYIRADANEVIGTGHVMRCLSIAEEMQRQGETVTFIIADERAEELVVSKGFPVICLHTVWDDLEQELDILLYIIKEHQIPLLILDSYYVTEYYLQQLRQYVRLVYIDDLNSFLYPVDLLINYNIYAAQLDYETRYRQAGLSTEFALGCQYAPLREEFKMTKRECRSEVAQIMITSGGTDSYNVIGHLLECLYKQEWFADIQYHIILGRFNQNRKMLEAQWEKVENVQFHVDVSNISDYMKQCDLAVTAAGSTVYELCACGIPSIMYTLADNQLAIARTISQMGIMPWAGDVRKELSDCLENIIYEIQILRADKDKRKKLSWNMMQLVDAKGCSRIVKQLKFMKLNL